MPAQNGFSTSNHTCYMNIDMRVTAQGMYMYIQCAHIIYHILSLLLMGLPHFQTPFNNLILF